MLSQTNSLFAEIVFPKSQVNVRKIMFTFPLKPPSSCPLEMGTRAIAFLSVSIVYLFHVTHRAAMSITVKWLRWVCLMAGFRLRLVWQPQFRTGRYVIAERPRLASFWPPLTGRPRSEYSLQ